MKNSALSLTLTVLLIGLLASCASNSRHIGCYSYQPSPSSTVNDCEIIDLPEVTNKNNLATEEFSITDEMNCKQVID